MSQDSMKVVVDAIDSEVFGGCVLHIADFDSAADFAEFEADYVGTPRSDLCRLQDSRGRTWSRFMPCSRRDSSSLNVR